MAPGLPQGTALLSCAAPSPASGVVPSLRFPHCEGKRGPRARARSNKYIDIVGGRLCHQGSACARAVRRGLREWREEGPEVLELLAVEPSGAVQVQRLKGKRRVDML